MSLQTYLNLIKEHHLPLVSVKEEAQNAYTFVFENQGVKYQAGQHFIFKLKHENVDNRKDFRVFSASSAPFEGYLSFTTRYFGEKSSSYKKALMTMQPGDKISVRGPSPLSDIYRIKDYTKPHIYIAGGVGVTPFRSILLDTLHEKKDLKGTLFFANRDQDFIFGDVIEDGISKLENFELHKIISPDKISKEFLNQELEKYGQDTIFTISGTEGFVRHYKDILSEDLGLSKKQVRAYEYKSFFGSY
jgi:ferredoxin-NADP reductase